MNIITSKDLICIEEGFKVEAGPGSGKTDFLVNHIKNTLLNSNRLLRTRKIACITYTNTGVNTILKRLGSNAAEKVEVSTIHGFLYENIIKPYAQFIPEDYKINCRLITGHNEFIVSRKYVGVWLGNDIFNSLEHPNSKKQLLGLSDQFKALKNWLLSMQCVYDNEEIFFKCDPRKAFYSNSRGKSFFINKSNLAILSDNLNELKKIYWQNGKIDHNDVLFFSVILINKYPFILDVLRSKFPYIFLDEYQDTSPVQAYIIDKIREKETIVGVIGDKAQSIYSFQGANPALFENFEVADGCKFTILENHRSSHEIVHFLNALRTDITQRMCNGRSGNEVCVIIGDRVSAYKKVQELCGKEIAIESLSRDNFISNVMKKDVSNSHISKNIENEFEEADSNKIRRTFVKEMIWAVELAKHSKYKEAMKHMERITDSQKEGLRLLSHILNKYHDYENEKLIKFYELLNQLCSKKLSAVTSGKVKEFYENTDYKNIAISVNITEDTSEHITIHKSKGNQFDNVFVVGDKNIKDFLLNPNLKEREEHRVAYVAFSRARNRLFIQFDSSMLSGDDEIMLKEKLDMIQIIRI